jgi:hypothetical protein
MRLVLCPLLACLLTGAVAADAAEPASHDPRALRTPALGCVTPELRAASFRHIDDDAIATYRLAMHHCFLAGAGPTRPPPRRT